MNFFIFVPSLGLSKTTARVGCSSSTAEKKAVRRDGGRKLIAYSICRANNALHSSSKNTYTLLVCRTVYSKQYIHFVPPSSCALPMPMIPVHHTVLLNCPARKWDALSWLLIGGVLEEKTPIPELVLMIENLKDTPLTPRQMVLWTTRDPLLSRVFLYTQERWPQQGLEKDLKPFWQRCTELSTHEGCILWGGRVVVPERGWEYALTELHGGNLAMMRMKALARGLVWWPCLDSMIERAVKDCPQCQETQPTPPVQPMQPWSWSTCPWSRLHIDFAGPLDERIFLVIVDAHTKWMDVVPMKTATSSHTALPQPDVHHLN